MQGLAYFLEPLNSLIYTWMFTDVLVNTYGGNYQTKLKVARFILLIVLVLANISLYVALVIANTKVTVFSLERNISQAFEWQQTSNSIQKSLNILNGVICGVSCIFMTLTVLHIRKLSRKMI